MSASESPDPYQLLQITLNPDGTLTRSSDDPRTPATSDPSLPISVLTKDLTINQSNNTWVRLFLPRNALDNNDHPSSNKLPLIVYFHGSGFILTSAASTKFHDFCSRMASDVAESVVASVEYRLAPEHRLPAAYDDAVEALHWLKTSPDEWLQKFVDFSNCYVMGSSAGGTIAYFAGLRAAEEVNDVEPMKIRGLILRQPFFGGTQRSESEKRLEKNPVFPMSVSDLLWELALPVGTNRDHEYSNPTAGDRPEKMEKIREVGWKVMVSGNGGDPLVDRAKEVATLMAEKGVEVVTDFDEEGGHGVEFIGDPSKASRLIALIKRFISSST